MKGMLSTTETRRVRIIECLYFRNNWVTLEELAQYADCSERILGTDFEFFEKNWKKYFIVEFSRRRGVRIHQNHAKKLSCIYAETFRLSQNFNFFEAIFFKPFQTIEFWEQEFFVSKATLYRMVAKIRDEMAKVQFEIDRQTFTAHCQNERILRKHYGSYFVQAYDENDWPFKEISKAKLLHLLRKFGTLQKIVLTDVQVVELAYQVAVTLTRLGQKFYLPEAMLAGEEREIEQSLFLMEKDFQKLVSFPLPPGWHKEIARTVFCDIFGWDNAGERERILTYIDELITQIAIDNELTIKEKDRASLKLLIANIYTEYKVYPYIRYSLFNNFQFQASRVYENYPNFSKKVVDAIRVIERRSNFPWSAKMQDRIVTYIFVSWTDLPVLLEQRREKVKMLVMSTFGETHANTLKEFLLKRFRSGVDCIVEPHSVYSMKFHERGFFDQYHMIVTTTALDFMPDEKIFVVDNVPSVRQISEIGAEIGRLQLIIHKSRV